MITHLNVIFKVAESQGINIITLGEFNLITTESHLTVSMKLRGKFHINFIMMIYINIMGLQLNLTILSCKEK